MTDRKHIGINEVLGAISRGMMGHGAFPATDRWKKLTFLESLIEITRPFLIIMAIPAVGMGAFLAPGALPSPFALAFGVLACILSVAGTHAFNDWVDRERDKTVWPNRPIPAGRFPAALGPFFALLLMGLAAVITWMAFNPTAAAILGITEILGILYCLFLRDRLGYLSLPFIIAIFPLGGWAAVSPETVFSNPLPWALGVIVLTWQAGHIMVYSPAHPIRDENGTLRCEKKALFFYPTPKQAASLGVFFVVLLFVESILLPIWVGLGIFYWCLALPAGLLAVLTAVRLLARPTDQQRSIFAFNAASMFLTFLCGGVVLDIVFRRDLGTFIAWGLSVADNLIKMIQDGAVTIEKTIYIAGLIITIGVALFSAVGLLKGVMKSEKVSENQ